jgi:hypothetical protein
VYETVHQFVAVKRVGVSVKLRVVAERLVAEGARPAALTAKAVALSVRPLFVLLDHFVAGPEFVTLAAKKNWLNHLCTGKRRLHFKTYLWNTPKKKKAFLWVEHTSGVPL